MSASHMLLRLWMQRLVNLFAANAVDHRVRAMRQRTYETPAALVIEAIRCPYASEKGKPPKLHQPPAASRFGPPIGREEKARQSAAGSL
jgi:hypothetical protein